MLEQIQQMTKQEKKVCLKSKELFIVQTHSCISHQMKVVNVDLQPNKLKGVVCMIVDILIGFLVEVLCL